MHRVLISAGDASGELHAAAFANALQTQLPGVEISGLGGPEMEKAGVSLIAHQRELAVGGLVEVLGDLRQVWSVYKRMRQAIREGRPDLLVLIDSPDFNLPLARVAKAAGVPVLYYVTPQVWAWRAYRTTKIAERVDRACVIFPFERELFAGSGLQVDFVGHPLVDRFPAAASHAERLRAREELGFDGQGPLFALLPGSRRNEIEHCLPLYLAVAREVAARNPAARFAIGVAPSIERGEIETAISAGPLTPRIVEGRTHDLARAADVALAKPGTVTLELALLGIPTVVAARANGLTAFLLRRVSHVSTLTLPNLIAGHPIVPEFLQKEAEPARIAMALLSLLDDPARENQKRGFARVAADLGAAGASVRSAAIAAEMVSGTSGS